MFPKLENSLAALFKITKKCRVPMPRQQFPSIKKIETIMLGKGISE